jgi:guanine deaminase
MTVFYGSVINTQSLASYQSLPNCLIAISVLGVIEWIVQEVPDSMVQHVLASKGCSDTHIVWLKYGEFLMPGFVDTHTVSTRGHVQATAIDY